MVDTPKKGSKWFSKIYSPVGFSKGYNFILWFIFAGALLGFTLARFMYLNFDRYFCPPNPSGGDGAAPGECYYYTSFTRDKVGIILHLAGILPASILVCLQFTPIIRHKWIMIHRICGYLAIFLYAASLVGALMIAHMAFGGGMDIQVWVGFVGIGVLVCLILSIINIKRLQIEQHRAWMLRAWFYVSFSQCIVEERSLTVTGWIYGYPSHHHDHCSHDTLEQGSLRRVVLREARAYS